MTMAQDVPYLPERSAALQEGGRQGMTQQMGSALWRVQPGPFERLLHDAANRCRPRELLKARPRRDEDVAGGTRRACLAEIGGQRLADLSKEGQPLACSAFAAN